MKPKQSPTQIQMERARLIQESERSYTEAAQILLRVFNPELARIVQPKVQFSQGDTPSMSGVHIRLPEDFEGVSVIQRPDIGMGLTAHELSHFLQPSFEIAAMLATLKGNVKLAHYVCNILMDIQGESFIESVFTGYGKSLYKVRALIRAHLLPILVDRRYEGSVGEQIATALCIGRFGNAKVPYSTNITDQQRLSRRCQAAVQMAERALYAAPSSMLDFVTNFLGQFPEILEQDERDQSQEGDNSEEKGNPSKSKEPKLPGQKQDTEKSEEGNETSDESDDSGEQEVSEGLSGEGEEDNGKNEEVKEAAKKQKLEKGNKATDTEEDKQNGLISAWMGVQVSATLQRSLKALKDRADMAVLHQRVSNHSKPVDPVRVTMDMTFPDAACRKLAGLISVRFESPKGGGEIVAPGYFDRRELAVEAPMPFRMFLTESNLPGMECVICVDRSGSMEATAPGTKQTKMEVALTASMALATAIEQSNGKVAGLVFGENAVVNAGGGYECLSNLEVPKLSDLNTTFLWLPFVWENYPDRRIIIITDGSGSIPPIIPQAAKDRTTVMVIPEGDMGKMRAIASHVVELKDLSDMPMVMASLIPRTWQ